MANSLKWLALAVGCLTIACGGDDASDVTPPGSDSGPNMDGTVPGTDSSRMDAPSPGTDGKAGGMDGSAGTDTGSQKDATSGTDGSAGMDAQSGTDGASKMDGGSGMDASGMDAASKADGASDAASKMDGTSGMDGASGDGASGMDAGTDARSGGDAGPVTGLPVLMYHNDLQRDGHYVDPRMTQTAAASLKIDTSFAGNLTVPTGGVVGTVWSQPLYVPNGVGGKGTFYVADDADNIFALDETTGNIVWSVAIDTPATSYGSGCGNDPGGGSGPGKYIGVTGTPVIDAANRVMYLVAVHAVGSNMPIGTYKIHALSIDSGSEITSPAGWPIDVSTITSASGVKFNVQPQIERGALALVNGYLYVPFGGEDGDCGNYHGWIVSVPVATPSAVTGYTTGTPKAGIWAVGGPASDGTDVFAVTSNGNGGSTWQGNEAVLRFHNGSAFSGATTDYFTPSNWSFLDGNDLDLGGTGAVVVDIAGTTPSKVVLAYSKYGVVHVLDRSNLGGVGTGDGMNGEGVFSMSVTSTQIRNGPVAYSTGGVTYTVFQASCTGGDLLALKFATSGAPSFSQAWCANSGSGGSPMVTTTDAAGSNPIVWMSGGTLTGWDGATGKQVFSGNAISLQNVSKWTTPINVNGRIFVGAGTQLYALTL
jgi:hypothetical protein